MVEVCGKQDDLLGCGRSWGILCTAQEGDGVPCVRALVLVEALAFEVADHAVGESGQGRALDEAEVFLGDGGEGFEAEGLEEGCGVESGDVFVASAGAAAVEFVGGEEVFVGVDA